MTTKVKINVNVNVKPNKTLELANAIRESINNKTFVIKSAKYAPLILDIIRRSITNPLLISKKQAKVLELAWEYSNISPRPNDAIPLELINGHLFPTDNKPLALKIQEYQDRLNKLAK